MHTARDTRVISWCQIYNVDSTRGAACNGKPAGVFLSGQQPLRKAGIDGLVNTATTTTRSAGWKRPSRPGLTTFSAIADDVGRRSPASLARSKSAKSCTNGVANPNLRRLRVRIRYGRMVRNQAGVIEPERVYELTTYISAIS